ncbi:MAG: zinc ribbon domain-containing protein [Oscillospiraceae bacterium]|jgi:hypothetical protein|nr:zinc ribbon domain-containing protein [Oscillospiraceae bacterium]
MYCNHCGKQLPDSSKFCSGCGSPIDADPVAPVPPVTPAAPAAVLFAPPKKRHGGLVALLVALAVLIPAVGVGTVVVLRYVIALNRDPAVQEAVEAVPEMYEGMSVEDGIGTRTQLCAWLGIGVE